jgi:hypothetical protein
MTNVTDETQRQAAIDYMRQQLGSGKTLAKLLLEVTDFQTGTIAVLNAVPLGGTEIMEFSWGHVPPDEEPPQHITILGQPFLAYPKANAHEEFVELIHNSLQDAEDLCLLEHFLASAGDAWLKRAKSRVGIHETDVYLILGLADRAKETIEDARSHAECLPVFVGAIGRQPPDPILGDPVDSNISTGQLRTFAKTAHCIFVGAYDGEGYVVWHSDRR